MKLFTSRQVLECQLTRNKTVIKEESTLGNLVTDAMVWANREKTTEDNERFMMAVHHSGGLRFLAVSLSNSQQSHLPGLI